MTAALAPRPDWRALWRSGHLSGFCFICLGIWLHAADELVIATIIPSIVNDIGGAPLLGWNLAVYEIGTIIMTVLMGRLAQQFAIKPAMMMTAGLYVIGCALSALAPAMEIMLLGRLLQGLGGGGLVAVAFISPERLFPRAIWPQLFAIMSIIWGSSAFCGPLIGGIFAEIGFWRGAFWVFAAQGALLAVFVPVVLRNYPDKHKAQTDLKPLPVVNLGVLIGAILLIAAAGLEQRYVLAGTMVLAGFLLLGFFFYKDGKASAARLFPSQPFALNRRLGAGMVMVFTLAVSTIGFSVYGPILLNILHGASPLLTGYLIASESIAWSLAAIMVAKAPVAMEKWLIRIGAGMVAMGLVLFTLITVSGPLWLIWTGAVLQGAGFGLCWAFIVGQMVDSASDDEKTITAAAVPAIQRIGYALGAALCGLIANTLGFSSGITVPAAKIVGFWLFFLFLPLAGLGIAAAIKMTAANQDA